MKKIFLLLILIIPLSRILGQAYWKEITTMRYPVTGGQVLFNNSRIEPKFYILGGYSDSLQKAVDWIQEYDLIKNTWKIVGKLNTPRMFFLSSIWDSSIVYCGGADPNSGFRESMTLWNYYKENEPVVYDTNSEFDREFAAGQVFQDRFFIIGGNSSNVQNQVSYLVEYDLNDKNITYTTSNENYKTTANPEDQQTFLVDTTIYILGGKYNGVQNWIKKFSINNKDIKDVPQTLPSPRAGGTAIYNKRLKKAFLIGGYSESQDALNTVEEINFKSDGSLIISPAPVLKYARRNPMVVNYLNTMVVFGGSNDISGKSVVKQVEQYTDTTATSVNNPPYFLTSEFPSFIEVLQPFTFLFTATDPDGDAVIFSLESGPAGSSISKAGLFKWTPTNDQANQNFNLTVKVSDGELSQTFTATVKTGPPIVIGVENDLIPTATALYQNYPNPFNPTTVITYSLRKDSHILITVYDLIGREITKLVDGYQNAGRHSVVLNGEKLTSGVYIYKLITDDYIGSKRMLLLK